MCALAGSVTACSKLNMANQTAGGAGPGQQNGAAHVQERGVSHSFGHVCEGGLPADAAAHAAPLEHEGGPVVDAPILSRPLDAPLLQVHAAAVQQLLLPLHCPSCQPGIARV